MVVVVVVVVVVMVVVMVVVLLLLLLLINVPAAGKLYLRDGSAETVALGATLR